MKEGNWPAAWRDRIKDKTRIVLNAFLPASMSIFRKVKGIQ
jgi:hypothetical protein